MKINVSTELEDLCVDARAAFVAAHGVYHHAKNRLQVTVAKTHSGSWPLPIITSYTAKKVEKYRLSMMEAESVWQQAKTDWENAK